MFETTFSWHNTILGITKILWGTLPLIALVVEDHWYKH